MTSIKKDKIFTKWLNILLDIEKYNLDELYSDITKDKFEEAAFDILSYYKLNKIKHISDIMFGETYTSLKKMKTTNNISFHHYHLYSKDIFKNYNYIKYEKEFNKL
jgi:hypothetical protein